MFVETGISIKDNLCKVLFTNLITFVYLKNNSLHRNETFLINHLEYLKYLNKKIETFFIVS